MVDLRCQGTDWVDRKDKNVLDAIFLWNGLILATLSMDKGKCGYLGCISGWFWAPKGTPRARDGWIRVLGYRWGRWICLRRFTCDFSAGWLHTSKKTNIFTFFKGSLKKLRWSKIFSRKCLISCLIGFLHHMAVPMCFQKSSYPISISTVR